MIDVIMTVVRVRIARDHKYKSRKYMRVESSAIKMYKYVGTNTSFRN